MFNFYGITQEMIMPFLGKEPAALIFEWTFSPCGVPKNENNLLSYFEILQKRAKRLDISFYYIHFEIIVDPFSLIGSHRCDLLTKRKKAIHCRKMRNNFCTFLNTGSLKQSWIGANKFCDFKMAVTKWCLNSLVWQFGNFGVKSCLRFQIKLELHTRLILKSRICAAGIWFQSRQYIWLKIEEP